MLEEKLQRTLLVHIYISYCQNHDKTHYSHFCSSIFYIHMIASLIYSFCRLLLLLADVQLLTKAPPISVRNTSLVNMCNCNYNRSCNLLAIYHQIKTFVVHLKLFITSNKFSFTGTESGYSDLFER